MAIMRLYTGKDGKSHFEDVPLKFEPRDDRSETVELIPGSGIIVRRFEPTRSNPWHNAPGHYAVFTLSGAVLIAEDLTGQGHITREVGPAPRVSIFVPLG
jgi:quercetin dioxygenase-like cupin family protein